MRAIELFELNIQRAEKLLNVHRLTYAKGRPASKGEGDDILRSVIVFSVSALDAYLHMRITEIVNEIIFKHKRIPEKVSKIIGNKYSSDDRPRELLKIAVSKNPRTKIINLLEKAISGSTFQKPDQINDALNYMEVSDPWKNLDKALSPPRTRKRGKKASCKTFLSGLTNRRDDIVHKGDVYVSDKFHGSLKPITRTFVSESIVKLRRVVSGLEDITKTK